MSADINRIALHCSCVLNKHYGGIDFVILYRGVLDFVVARLLFWNVGETNDLFIFLYVVSMITTCILLNSNLFFYIHLACFCINFDLY